MREPTIPGDKPTEQKLTSSNYQVLMKKKSAKQPKKAQIKVQDIKPRKDARGGRSVSGRITGIAVDPSDP